MPPTTALVHDDETRLVRVEAAIHQAERDYHLLQAGPRISSAKLPTNIHQEQLRSLDAERVKLVANIAASRVRHAPMRTLLPEICDIVFAYCCPAECDLHCAWSYQGLDTIAPIALTRVCRRWRHLVITNPRLWTRIHVRPLALDAIRVRLWLERSAELPLQVTICSEFLRDKGWGSRSISRMTEPLLQHLIPHFHRVQSFRAHLALEILPNLFSSGGVTNMPTLEQLDLLVEDPLSSPPAPGLLLTPALKHLRVRDITLLFEAVFSGLHTVQSLTIQECSTWKYPIFFPYLLAACTQLQICSITFPNSLFLPSVSTTELPELRSLSLEWPYLFDPSPLFRALRAPKLRSLRLVHQTRQLNLPSQTLASLCGLVQSAPSLRALTLEGCNLVAPHEAHALFMECRALERLFILRCQRGDRFLVPLTPPDPASSAEWVCPHLTHVALGAVQDADVRSIVLFARRRARRRSDDGTKMDKNYVRRGGAYLQELRLHTELYSLTGGARLLMLSGLLGVHRSVNIVGPFGTLFEAAQESSPALAAICG